MIFKGAARRQGSTGGVARLHQYITDPRKADAVSYEHLIDGRTAPAVMQALAERNARAPLRSPKYRIADAVTSPAAPKDSSMLAKPRLLARPGW